MADAAAAKAFAAQRGTPIVLKGVVDGIEHKSDVGLVQLHLDTPDKVAQAFERIGRAMAG